MVVAGAVPYLLMVLMRYEPVPPDWRAWVEKLFYYVFIALTVNQAAHAVDKTREDREVQELAFIESQVPHDCCDH